MLPGLTLVAASLLLPRAVRAADSWTDRSAVGVELGLGGIITRYSPDAPDGGSVFLSTIRGNYDLGPDTSVSVLLRQWSLPGSNHATMPGVGGRFEPYQGGVGRAFVDIDLGPTWTRDKLTLGFDLGGGFEVDFPAVAGLGIGPSFHYGQVVNPASTNMGANDGRSWALGLSATFHIGRWSRDAAAARAQSPTGGRPVRPYTFKVTDADHDGVSDESDQCPEVPAGRHPDAFRPGCPENDEDGDGVPDGDDVCPATAAGAHPDRARRGCPFEDSDGDGVADPDDHCPDRPGPATRDPATNGCPVARKAAVQPDEAQEHKTDGASDSSSAESSSPTGLKPVSKRRLRGPRPSPTATP